MFGTIRILAFLSICSAGPALAAPILLMEFIAEDFALRAGSAPATVPFRFSASDSPLLYFSWEAGYGPNDVGMTFSAPPDTVEGANDAIKSPTATYITTMAEIRFQSFQPTSPGCGGGNCQVFVPVALLPAHTVTSVERIIDELVITGFVGVQYSVEGTQRIRIWGEPISEPSTIVLLVMGIGSYVLVTWRELPLPISVRAASSKTAEFWN